MRVENILIRKIDSLNKTDKKKHILIDYEVEGKSKQFRASFREYKTGWIHRSNVKFLKGVLFKGDVYKGGLVMNGLRSKEEHVSTFCILKLEEGGKVIVNGLVLDLSPNYYEIKLQIEKTKDGKIGFANQKIKGDKRPFTLWRFGYQKEVRETYEEEELEDSRETEYLLYQISEKKLTTQKVLHLIYQYLNLGKSKKKSAIDKEVMLIDKTVSKKQIEDWILVQSQKFRKIKYEDFYPEISALNKFVSGELSSTDCVELLTKYYPSQRNYFIDRFGFQQFFETLNHRILSSNEKEELIETENGLKFLKYSNYCVALPTEIGTIKEALDWSFGLFA